MTLGVGLVVKIRRSRERTRFVTLTQRTSSLEEMLDIDDDDDVLTRALRIRMTLHDQKMMRNRIWAQKLKDQW